MLAAQALLALIAFLLGAALFSFMNVVAWRLPRGKNPLTGRSFCPQCGATLTAADLVPVFSWLALHGRCRHCGARIPARYLAVELLGGVLALGCRWRFGAAYALADGLFGIRWQGLAALALCGVLLSIALIDAETQLIPNRLNAAVAVLAVVELLLSPARWGGCVVGALCVSVPMLPKPRSSRRIMASPEMPPVLMSLGIRNMAKPRAKRALPMAVVPAHRISFQIRFFISPSPYTSKAACFSWLSSGLSKAPAAGMDFIR